MTPRFPKIWSSKTTFPGSFAKDTADHHRQQMLLPALASGRWVPGPVEQALLALLLRQAAGTGFDQPILEGVVF